MRVIGELHIKNEMNKKTHFKKNYNKSVKNS